jgi:hypothetical protein
MNLLAELIKIRDELRAIRNLVVQHPEKSLHCMRIPLRHLDFSLSQLTAEVRIANAASNYAACDSEAARYEQRDAS